SACPSRGNGRAPPPTPPATTFPYTALLRSDPPTANAQSVSTPEDTALAITLSGTDVETPAASLVFTVTQAPAHGSLSGTGVSLTFGRAQVYTRVTSRERMPSATGNRQAAAL